MCDDFKVSDQISLSFSPDNMSHTTINKLRFNLNFGYPGHHVEQYGTRTPQASAGWAALVLNRLSVHQMPLLFNRKVAVFFF